MAVIIKNTEEKQVKFNNTEITIDDVYVRLIFVAKANGTDVEVELIPYENKEKFDESLQINNINLPRTISGEVSEQTLANVHSLTKVKLEELGYEVIIDLT